MKNFTDDQGRAWTADAREEPTPRHHGRWYLVFRSAEGGELAMPEVRWQTMATAKRTLLTMSDFELRRRLHNLLGRHGSNDGTSPIEALPVYRATTNLSAG